MTLKDLFAVDKIVHLKGGLALLAAGIIGIFLGLVFRLQPITVVLIICGISGAFSVEGSQWSSNKAAVANGLPKPHDVSFLDAFMSFLPCVAAAVVYEVLYRFGYIPSYDDMSQLLRSVLQTSETVPTVSG